MRGVRLWGNFQSAFRLPAGNFSSLLFQALQNSLMWFSESSMKQGTNPSPPTTWCVVRGRSDRPLTTHWSLKLSVWTRILHTTFSLIPERYCAQNHLAFQRLTITVQITESMEFIWLTSNSCAPPPGITPLYRVIQKKSHF